MYDEKLKLMEEEILPFGFIDDGVEELQNWTDPSGERWTLVDPIFKL